MAELHEGEARLGATSTTNAPWHIVPADDKKNDRLIISEILLDVFKGLKMAYPEATAKRLRELQLIRKTLVKEAMRGKRNLTKALASRVGLYPIAKPTQPVHIKHRHPRRSRGNCFLKRAGREDVSSEHRRNTETKELLC